MVQQTHAKIPPRPPSQAVLANRHEGPDHVPTHRSPGSRYVGDLRQRDMNVCHTWYFVKGDSDNPPNVRQDSCDFCS